MVILLGNANSLYFPGEPDEFWFIPLKLVPCELLKRKRLILLAGLQEEMDIVACTIPKFTLERKTNQAALEENAAFFCLALSSLCAEFALSSVILKEDEHNKLMQTQTFLTATGLSGCFCDHC